MGIYGMGQAFNINYRKHFTPGTIRRPLPGPPIPMGGNYSESTNVTINNGPQGFWGLALGAWSAYCQCGAPGLGGAQQAQVSGGGSSDKLKNLQKLFSNYTIVDDGNGSFTAKGPGGTFRGNYDSIIDQLSEAKETKPQGDNTTPTQTTTPTETTTPAQTTPTTQVTTPQGDTPTYGTAATAESIKEFLGKTVKINVEDKSDKISDFMDRDAKISLEVTNESDGAAGFPKSIDMGGKTYNFERYDSNTKHAIYRSAHNPNNNPQDYRLEINANQVQLNQYKGDPGYNTGDY